MTFMKGKRGRPATGRKESYYVVNPENFERHVRKTKEERMTIALDYIHTMAFDVPLTWKQKQNLKEHIKEMVK
jgi:penicillin-binding protein-related factor A (putative recombinase)